MNEFELTTDKELARNPQEPRDPAADANEDPGSDNSAAPISSQVAGSAQQSEPAPAPQSVETHPAPVTTLAKDPLVASDTDHFSFVFRDGLDVPIQGLEFFVTLPTGQVCTATSTVQGAITVPVPEGATGQAKVEVKDAAGNRQQVCSVDLARCDDVVIIRSPKVKAELPLRAHQQTPPASAKTQTKPNGLTQKNPEGGGAAKPSATKAAVNTTQPSVSDTWWSANGAMSQAWKWLKDFASVGENPPLVVAKSPVLAKTLSTAGQPVTVIVGPECPNKDKLRLGRNGVYREAILDASKRLGLIPQALCALMDCEAGKVVEHIPKLGPDGKQLVDKKGNALTTTIRDLWNANAGNPQSGAAGLTQFLVSTWLSHVLQPGLYIHTQSVARSWVRKDTNAKGQSRWVFVLTDGSVTALPYEKRGSDDNVKACLAMRMDPTWSINAAADYGNANLKVLEKCGFKLTGLTDMDKAKLMYLLHHEGEGAGPLFIRNTLASGKGGVEGLRSKFATQLGGNGAVKAKELIEDADDNVELAYRKWLAGFVDRQFSGSSVYFCSQPVLPSSLSELLVTIGGEKIHVVV